MSLCFVKNIVFLLLIRQSTCTKLLYILRTVSNYSVWSFVRAGDVLELSKEKTNKYFLKPSSFNMINNTFSQNKISSTRPLINWMIKHMFSLFSKLCLLLISSNSCCSIYFISQLHKISLFKCPVKGRFKRQKLHSDTHDAVYNLLLYPKLKF